MRAINGFGWMLAASVFCWVGVSNAEAQEWTRFRGPNGSGMSQTTMPAKWTDKDYAWKIELPGGGNSSPVLWGQKLFITSASKTSGQRTIFCIDGNSGKVLWKRSYDAGPYRMHNDNSAASPTPAVDDQRVYIVWATPTDSQVIALDHNGKELWKTEIGPFIGGHGAGASPIVVDDVVVLPFDQEGGGDTDSPKSSKSKKAAAKPQEEVKSFVIGLDRATGKQRWKTARKAKLLATATPCVFTPAGGAAQVVLNSTTEGMTGLDPKTGAVIWQANEVFSKRVVSSPVVAGDVVIGTCGNGGIGRGIAAVRPAASAGKKAEVAWQRTKDLPYVPTPLFKDGLLYELGDAGLVSCRKAATDELVWQEKIEGAFYSSLVCAGNRLYAVSKKGDVFVMAAGEKFEVLGQNSLGEASFATPAIANGRMYLRTSQSPTKKGEKAPENPVSHLFCLVGSAK